MGYYTRIIFSACLKIEDDNIVNVLKWLSGEGVGDSEKFPDHSFFNSKRMECIMCGSDCSTHTISKFEKFEKIGNDYEYFLSFMSSFKNYDNEIQKFLSWIRPYIYMGAGGRGYYAIVCTEDQKEPTIYYLE